MKHNLHSSNRRGKSLVVALSAALACVMLISSMGIVGEVYAKPNTAPAASGTVSEAATVAEGTQFTVNYSSGAMSSAFSGVQKVYTADVSGCITLTGPALSNVATVSGGKDSETVMGSDGWYYSFTGWHIVGQSEKLPAETVFQPGDVITPEVLTQYASGGTLNLEALWGRCYFIQNPYTNMVYEQVTRWYISGGEWKETGKLPLLSTTKSTGATTAYDMKNGAANTGKDPNTPIATVDHLYSCLNADHTAQYDAYSVVAMLTGDLDYVKQRYMPESFGNPTADQITSLQNQGKTYVAAGTQENNYVDAAGYVCRVTQTRAFGESTYARGVTFKSLGGTTHKLLIKAKDDQANYYGSLRLDNVHAETKHDSEKTTFFGDTAGVILHCYDGNRDTTNYASAESYETAAHTQQYIEITARCTYVSGTNYSPYSNLRAYLCERIVLNGGRMSIANVGWSAPNDDLARHWYVGRNARLNNLVDGISDGVGTSRHSGNAYITVTGGTVSNLYGGGESAKAEAALHGDRIIRLYGASGHQPTVNLINGGGLSTPIVGDVDILAIGCTSLGAVYGGGQNYTASVTGNINISLINCKVNGYGSGNNAVSGDVYGGGKYADCKDDGSNTKGKVTINIQGSTIAGTIYGSGRGNLNTVETGTTGNQGFDNVPSHWHTAPTGFPELRQDDYAFVQTVFHRLGRRSGISYSDKGTVIWGVITRTVFQSVASVESSNISIADSTVNSVYGGGTMAIVRGDTNISISGSSTVKGNVYGGGDGSESVQKVTVYDPCDQEKYNPPMPYWDDATGQYEYGVQYHTDNPGTWYYGESKGEYTWSNDPNLISEAYINADPENRAFGIDHTRQVVYTPYDTAQAGQVMGDATVTIGGNVTMNAAVYGGGKQGAVAGKTTVEIASGTFKGNVYGGGDAGKVNGSATLNIENGTINSGVSVFGGGKSASVASTEVNIKGGTFGSDKNGNIYGGGDAGAVIGGTVVNIEAGTFGGARVYGGGKSASVASTSVNITGGNFSSSTGLVYGGGQNGSVTGAAEITVKNLSKDNPIYYQILGGGFKGTVGSVTINLENSTFLHNIYGGGDQSSATVLEDVTLNATDITHGTPYDSKDEIEPSIYGGGYKADVNGNVEMNLTDGVYEWVFGGGYAGACQDVTLNLRGNKQVQSPHTSSRTATGPALQWCLRGGGKDGECRNVVVNMWSGDVGRNTHTAGQSSTVANATFNMYGGYTANIFGGGDWGDVTGNSQVNLYGGSVGTIYGGSDRPSSRVGGSCVVVDDDHDDDPNTAGVQNTASLTIRGSIYGGCDQGIVMPRGTSNKSLEENSDGKYVMGTGTSVTFNGTGRTQVEIISGTVPYAVYAGGRGSGDTDAKEASGNANFGSILGSDTDGYSTKLLISGGVANASVFGGNDASGQIAGNTLVQITGGSVNSYVYGGNLGNKSNNAVGASIAGTAFVKISGGTVGADGKLIFGGNSALGTVGATDVQITNMDPLDASTVYGGNNAGGVVTNQAKVTITNSTVTYAFGGNYSGGTVGSSLVTVNGSTATSVYGGNETNGTVTDEAAVVVENSTVESGVYGGNFQGGTVDSTQVTFTDSTCTNTGGGIYGGNNAGGTVTNDAKVTINSGKYLRVYGGNKTKGDVFGDTVITVNQGVSNEWKTSDGKAQSPYVFGGNDNGGTVHGDSNIIMTMPASDYHLSCIYGGNNVQGTVAGKANITLNSGVIYARIVGGNHNGGTVGTSGKESTSGVNIVLPANGLSKRIDRLYGGNYQGGTIYGDVDITIAEGTAQYDVFGGNYKEGTITGKVDFRLQGGSVPNLYGGNDNGGSIGTKGNANTGVTVNMTGGTVNTNLYGGSNQTGTIAGTMNITMTGGRVVHKFFGGGNAADVTTDVTALNVTLGGTTMIVQEGTNDGGWIYAGGNEADCHLIPKMTIEGNCDLRYVFGGGRSGSVYGTDVSVTNCKNLSALFGGSDASDGSVGSTDRPGNTSVKVSGGTIDSIRGGGNFATTYGDTYVEFTGGTVTSYINGAGNKSVVTGNAKVVVSGGILGRTDGTWGHVFGGADSGTSGSTIQPAYLYGDATVIVKDNANITGSVFGAGNNEWAHSYGNAYITINGGTIGGSVYGGGNEGLMEIDTEKNADGGDTAITVTGGSIGTNIYGGGNNAPVPGNATINCTKLSLGGTLYGGGNNGELGGDVSITVNSGTVKGNIFGGGADADVGGKVNIAIKGGNFNKNVYGGGEHGDVTGRVTMNITGGDFNNAQQTPVEVYGGGKNGTVYATKVDITGGTNISGSVFGGGEGFTATVYTGTDVHIDIPFSFQVHEEIYTTDDITSSGRVESQLTPNMDMEVENGAIVGSVYGGGNLGRVGQGTISAGGDKADIHTEATTKVQIDHGQILGSVFGGGRGIPDAGVTYDIRMGTVFGGTDVDILGGLIMGNVYGGGEQSRVYATGTDRKAATVDITETQTDTGFEKIGINGSVFGGGDRGDSDSANASVPTVYGDVEVTITGHKDNQPSEIYFLNGGVYGDGNLCLVDGNRKITVKDFEPSPDRDKLKTFFSLQRADLAVLDNSAVVLLGAVDLVEEGDNTLYSINRIGRLELLNGSTVKLDQVVKYMGDLYSDVDTSRKFIRNGQNGFTGTYDKFITGEKCECGLNVAEHKCNLLKPLSDDEIQAYHESKKETKNVVCVANGLYLEVINEEDEYGPVTGLFTLQLTYANPGEGGGFVYGNLPNSTGDFICETPRWTFVAYKSGEVTASNYQTLLDKNEVFVRVTGKGFRRPGATFDANKTYYSRQESLDSNGKVVYMDIIDDVGGAIVSNDGITGFAYYYWYIGGPSVTFDVEVTGYIGAAETSFKTDSALPQHAAYDRAYVLYGVEVNEAMRDAVLGSNATYELVQTGSNLSGKQIAVELKAGDGTSLGFLRYADGVWGIENGSKVMTGYLGSGDAKIVKNNNLITMKVGPTNDKMTWVLHKSNDVAKTCSGLEVYLDIDLFEAFGTGDPVAVSTGTSSLSYTTSLSIVRLTATQSAFVQNGGNYNGVASNETVHITGSSKFTAEWQTRYVPAANPKEDGMFMTWGLSTQTYTYYLHDASGAYFTCKPRLGGGEEAFNFSDGLKGVDFESEFVKLSDGNYKRGNDIYTAWSSFSANPIPTRTRITMVDMNGSTPAYYYYICTGDMSYIDLQDFKLMGTNTTIRSLADSAKPAFIKAYDAQTMSMITERLVFVFDVSQTDLTSEFVGGLTLQHMYGNNSAPVDILDYAKVNDLDGKYDRYVPKDLTYKFNPGSTGVNANAYTAAFEATAYNDIGNAVLNVHVEEDGQWINTLFRENGFAVKVSLVDANGNSQPMPAGMYFEYRGEHYYPGPDSTYVSVPVHEFGDHEIIIHNPQFSLATAAGGNTARFKVEYYSAPDANYYNSFNTQVFQNASYSIIASDSYSLKVESGDDIQIYESGETVKVEYTTAKSDGAAAKTVSVTAYSKANGEYTELDWQKLFSGAQSKTMAEGTRVVCQWTIADNATSGTYRLVFTYADHTEYVNIIIK